MANVVVDIRTAPEAILRLEQLGQVYVATEPRGLQKEARPLPASVIRDVEILICTVPPANFDEARSLKLVQLGSVGFAQLYPHNLVARGIRANCVSIEPSPRPPGGRAGLTGSAPRRPDGRRRPRHPLLLPAPARLQRYSGNISARPRWVTATRCLRSSGFCGTSTVAS